MTARDLAVAAMVAVAAMAAPACSNDPTGPAYNPDIPAAWAVAVTNQYYPLVSGTTYQYQSDTPDGVETITTVVLAQTKTIQGVVATTVHDQAFLDGVLIEDTEDWYAQDVDGNVWYLGEDTKSYQNGQVASTAGSWQWGLSGALPGIIMWADPAAHLGEKYRQEFARGEAEDFGQVVALDQAVTVPHGSFTGCVKTEDTSAIEPTLQENKYYCPDIGLTLETNLQGGARVELVGVTP